MRLLSGSHPDPVLDFVPEFRLMELDARRFRESRVVEREGQGTFRLRLCGPTAASAP